MLVDEVPFLTWDARRLRIATDAAGIALWSWNTDTDEIALDERARALWGVCKDGPVTFEDLSASIHPEDLDRVPRSFKGYLWIEDFYTVGRALQR